MTSRRLEYMRLSDIPTAHLNPKQHDTAGIRTSIGAQGFVEPLLLDERTGRLIAGHGRLDDLKERQAMRADPPDGIMFDAATGEYLAPVIRGWSSESDAHARAYVVASNKLSENGGWDMDTLPEYLAGLADMNLLELSGFSPDEVAKMLDDGAGAGLAEALDESGESYAVVIACADNREAETTREALVELGYNADIVTDRE